MRASLPIAMTPDSHEYLRGAENLRAAGCFEAPGPGDPCSPAWGQQPRGYYLFLFLTSYAGGAVAAVAIQSLLLMVAATWLAWQFYLWHGRTAVLIASIGTAAFAPISVGMSRTVLTETLAAAAVLWLVAEVVQAVRARRFLAWRLALPLATGMLLRWDAVVHLAAVALILLLSFPTKRDIRRIAAVVGLALVPYGFLMARAASAGLSLHPSAIAKEGALPGGVIEFFRTAALDERGTEGLLWPVIGRTYERVDTTALDAFRSDLPKHTLAGLLVALQRTPSGEPVSQVLNARFAHVAKDLAGRPIRTWIALPLERSRRVVHRWLGVGVPFSAWGRGGASIVMVGGSLLVLAGAMLTKRLRHSPLGAAMGLILGIGAVRTIFLTLPPVSALEVRYMMPLHPTLEVVAVVALFSMLPPEFRRSRVDASPSA